MKQVELAQQLGISKSYLSMILSGQRKATPELVNKLQSTPGIHKVVNNDLWNRLYTQEVRQSRTTESRAKPIFLTAGGVVRYLVREGSFIAPLLILTFPLSLTSRHTRLQPTTSIVVSEVKGLSQTTWDTM